MLFPDSSTEVVSWTWIWEGKASRDKPNGVQSGQGKRRVSPVGVYSLPTSFRAENKEGEPVVPAVQRAGSGL